MMRHTTEERNMRRRRRHTSDNTMLIAFGAMGYVLGFALLSFLGWGVYMHLTHM